MHLLKDAILYPNFFLDCISQKYSGKVANKYWADIRRAVNQKCNDIRKRNMAGSTGHLQDGK
jgi:hypothetical protein